MNRNLCSKWQMSMCNEQSNNETEGKTPQVMCEQLNTCGEDDAWSWMGNPRQHPRSRRSGYPQAMPLAGCRTISFCRIPSAKIWREEASSNRDQTEIAVNSDPGRRPRGSATMQELGKKSANVAAGSGTCCSAYVLYI